MRACGGLTPPPCQPKHDATPLGEENPVQSLPQSIDAVETLLSGEGYVASRALATVVFLSLKLGRPLFLEGEAGVGKTEIAKVLAQALGRRLIRLQCYEGLDAASAVCEWNFAAQMIAIRTAEAGGGAVAATGVGTDNSADDLAAAIKNRALHLLVSPIGPAHYCATVPSLMPSKTAARCDSPRRHFFCPLSTA